MLKNNPEKLMLLMFPLVTLGVFVAGILLLHYLLKFMGIEG